MNDVAPTPHFSLTDAILDHSKSQNYFLVMKHEIGLFEKSFLSQNWKNGDKNVQIFPFDDRIKWKC